MKKIEFGFSNDLNPTGSWQGMGISDTVRIPRADYYGAFSFEDNNYILAKIVEDNNFTIDPELLGKYIVKKALCDLFADGSSIMMINQEDDNVCSQLNDIVNRENTVQYLDKTGDITSLPFYSPAPISFKINEMMSYDHVTVTAITPQAFEEKNEAIKTCHSSISELNSASREYTR